MMPPWSPMILATRARPRPEPCAFVVTKGSKRWGIRSCGHARPVVAHAEFERQADPLRRGAGSDSFTPGLNAVVSAISPSLASVADRFGGILDEIEEDLDELIAIGEHRRQRRIVVFARN